MKLYKYNERNKYDAKKDKDGNIIVEYRGKGRATSHYIGISSLPEYVDTGNVYYEKSNTEFMIADTRRMSTKTNPSKDELYYKVITGQRMMYIIYLILNISTFRQNILIYTEMA